MYSERKFKEMQYLLRFPEKFSETEKHPVLILMHGAGTRSEHLDKLKERVFFSLSGRRCSPRNSAYRSM